MGSTVATALVLFLAVVPAVFAVTFQVGDIDGWNSGVNYTAWATGKTFRVGDTLEFIYGPSHSVSVVGKAGFDACDGSGATQNFFDGDTKINLATVGTIHFLCPTPGHCLGGMKLAVPVLAAAPSPATPSPPSPRTPPSSTPSAPSPRTPPSSTPSPPLAPRSSRKPKPPPPSASPPSKGTPVSVSSTPSPSPSQSQTTTPSPSPSSPNAASKGVMMSYGMMGLTMLLMYMS